MLVVNIRADLTRIGMPEKKQQQKNQSKILMFPDFERVDAARVST